MPGRSQLCPPAPVQNEPPVGFDQENARPAGRIENYAIPGHELVEPIPAQRLFQHQPDKSGRGVDRTRRVLHKELVDIADQFDRQVAEGIQPPEAELARCCLHNPRRGARKRVSSVLAANAARSSSVNLKT
jgi:hypothetical protein